MNDTQRNRLLTNVTYLDVTSGTWKGPADIVVENGVIKAIGQLADSSTAPVLDCSNKYVIPGLTDMHVHIIWAGNTLNPVRKMLDDGALKTVLHGAVNSQLTLQQGITTIRDVGSMEDMAFDLAEVFAEGDLLGPNLVPCGRLLQCTGGHVPDLGIIVDSPTEIKRAIRYLKSRGSHWVKIAATGGAFGPEAIGPVLFDQDEIRMIVDTAHSLNMKVAAHALSKAGIKQCVDEGIDTIEHGADIDEEYLHKMVEKDLVLVPTLAIYDVLAHSSGVLPQLYVDKSVTVTNWQHETFRKAMEIGVKIALGTDAGSVNFGRHPSVLQEMRMMQKHGMPIPDILRSATMIPAEILKMHNHGRIEEGMVADLVGLKTNPLDSLDAFEAIDFVLKDGRRAR